MAAADPNLPEPAGAAAADPAPRARRRMGCLARTGCGLLAFLIGAGLMLVFLVPPLVGRWVEREAEDDFARTREGRIELEGVRLDWFRRQGVERAAVFDPEGQQVARADVELPSIASFVRAFVALERGERHRLDPIRVRVDAELVVDEDGVTNLERALAWRPGHEPAVSVETREPGDRPITDHLELLDAEVILSSARIAISTPETRATGHEYALADLDARLVLKPGQPLRVLVGAHLAGDDAARLALEGRLAGLRQTRQGVEFERGQLEASLESWPTALVGALLGHEQDLEAVVGRRADVRLEALHEPESQDRVDLELRGERGRARLALRQVEGVLALDPALPAEVHLAAPAAWVEERLAVLLPEGVRVTSGEESLELTLSLRELSVPIPEPFDAAALEVTQVRLAGSVSLGSLELAYTPPPDAPDGAAAGDEPGDEPGEPGAPRQPVEQRLTGASLDFAYAPDAGLGATLNAQLEPEGRVAAEVRASGVQQTAEGFLAERVEVDALLERLPTEPLGLLLGLEQDLQALFGPRVDARLLANLTDGAGSHADVELTSERTRGRLSLLERDGRLELDPRSSSELVLAAPREWLVARLTPMLPDGMALRPLEEELGATLSLSELSWPLPERLLERGARPATEPLDGPGDPAPALDLDLSALRLVARAELGGVELEYLPPADPAAPEAPNAQATPRAPEGRQEPRARTAQLTRGEPEAPRQTVVQQLLGSTLELSLDPGEGLVAALRAQLEGGGNLEGDVRAPAAAVRAALAGEEPSGIEVDARAQGFPTAVVDAFAQQEGLLVDVLGDRLSGRAEARGIGPELEGTRLDARLESELGRVSFTGRVIEQRLVSGADEGLNATARLSPLLSERIIGPLVPLLVSLGQPAGAEPIQITVRDLVIPLAADPAGVRASIRLELGTVTAQLVPGLGDHLRGVAELQPYEHRLLPFEVQVADGVASYTALPIQIDGKQFDLAGTYSLLDGRIDFRTELPLQYLGGEVREALRAVEEFVPQDLTVPVGLVGTLSRPRLAVPEDFAADLLRDATRRGIGDQLERKGRDALRDLLDRTRRRDG